MLRALASSPGAHEDDRFLAFGLLHCETSQEDEEEVGYKYMLTCWLGGCGGTRPSSAEPLLDDAGDGLRFPALVGYDELWPAM